MKKFLLLILLSILISCSQPSYKYIIEETKKFYPNIKTIYAGPDRQQSIAVSKDGIITVWSWGDYIHQYSYHIEAYPKIYEEEK